MQPFSQLRSQVATGGSIPWTKPKNVYTAKLIEQVKKCPSGALSYFMNEGGG
jgi:uncharacterized Fe-S cluster protein YjdI